jgi:hypothetical protein
VHSEICEYAEAAIHSTFFIIIVSQQDSYVVDSRKKLKPDARQIKVALQVIRANLGFFTDLGKNSDGGIEKKES